MRFIALGPWMKSVTNHTLNKMYLFRSAATPMMTPGIQAVNNPMFKTTLCQNMMNENHCSHGMMCKFAHSTAELRTPGQATPVAAAFSQPQGIPSPSNVMIHGTDGKIKYKTSMCTVFMEQGFCPRGEACGFAHSAKQLLEVISKYF